MRVLVVEDFPPLRKSLVQGLREAGYAVDEAADGELALWHARSDEHDVIILDLMLPKVGGLAVLEELRRRSCPAHVLILTAKDTTEDKVNGLELGADDYLVKPFQFAELLARVKALVRASTRPAAPSCAWGTWRSICRRRAVRRGGHAMHLSGREYDLLEYLAMNAGRTVSRADLERHVYDSHESPESNVVDVYIGRLRARIERPDRPRLIHTRRGQGYLLAEMPETAGAPESRDSGDPE